MKFSTVAAIGLSVLLPAVEASFMATCSNWFWEDGHYMVADCKKADGSNRRTRQDMNLCIGATSAGYLVSQNNGNFERNCKNIKKGSGSILEASCYSGVFAVFVPTSIDLNTFVHNSNGFLDCHGHLGAPR
ncbi:hypothetical protein QBC35DRAFT_448589 [Podospora australis]|uniref:Cyanovirin-N domain-containing protein n=1 Tax=Podospora australis TaxID=1536484 RepID=A0AAN7AJT4_9PEZI|nr:hypothetical protein QBC35DRAFT_448589 [Podospora australis]